MTSLARPGGNITGLSNFNDDLSVKRLDLLKEAFPRIRRVAVLFANLNPTGTVLQAMEVAAKPLKLELHPFSVKGPNEFEGAFSAMSQRRVEAVVITDTTMFIANAREVASLAAKHRIPSIGFIDIAETGGLMAYGANRLNLYHRATFFIDKIVKGTKPGDLPVERSTTFELVINVKAAKDLGIKIPQSLLHVLTGLSNEQSSQIACRAWRRRACSAVKLIRSTAGQSLAHRISFTECSPGISRLWHYRGVPAGNA
jgi:putative ABC transport system substrate-binding protein